MRLDIHVHVSPSADVIRLIKDGFQDVLEAIGKLRKRETTMNQNLQDVVSGLTGRVSGIDTTLGSIAAFIAGVPALTAAAVSKALADADVDEAAAASAVSGAFDDVSAHLQPIMDAITSSTSDQGNTPPITPDPLPTDDGANSVNGGQGTESVDNGGGAPLEE